MDSFQYISVTSLNQSQISEIENLRKIEYQERYGYQLNTQNLNWNTVDQSSVHFCAFDGQKLISTLRLTVHSNKMSVENSTCLPTPSGLHFPVCLLARAATLKKYASQGIHTKLRIMAFEYALENLIFTILGTLELSAPRMTQLKDIGYQILNESPDWKSSFIKPKGSVALVGLISKPSIQLALQSLRAQNSIST
jgi:hypothetical protein